MIVVRLEFKNGLHLEYNFPEIATAQVIYERLSVSMREKELVSFDDFAGRAAWVDAAQLQAIGLIDIEVEARSVVAVNLLVEAAGRAAMPRARPVMPDGAPTPRHDA